MRVFNQGRTVFGNLTEGSVTQVNCPAPVYIRSVPSYSPPPAPVLYLPSYLPLNIPCKHYIVTRASCEYSKSSHSQFIASYQSQNPGDPLQSSVYFFFFLMALELVAQDFRTLALLSISLWVQTLCSFLPLSLPYQNNYWSYKLSEADTHLPHALTYWTQVFGIYL